MQCHKSIPCPVCSYRRNFYDCDLCGGSGRFYMAVNEPWQLEDRTSLLSLAAVFFILFAIGATWLLIYK